MVLLVAVLAWFFAAHEDTADLCRPRVGEAVGLLCPVYGPVPVGASASPVDLDRRRSW